MIGAIAVVLFSPRLAWSSADAVDPPSESAETSREHRAPSSRHPQKASGMKRFRAETELGAFLATPMDADGGALGIGWRIALGIGYDQIPLTVGLDFQSAYFAESSSRDVLRVGSAALEFDQSRSDSVLFLDVFARLQPPFWQLRPFLEGVVGPKRLRTDYAVMFVNGSGTADETTNDDWTYTLGLGAGLDLRLGERLWLTAGVRHLAGGRAAYSHAVGPTSDAVVHHDTSTTTTTFSLGLIGRFSGSTEGD